MAAYPKAPVKRPASAAPKAGSDELSAFGEYADDAFAAIKSGDKGAFKSALKNAIKACYASNEE